MYTKYIKKDLEGKFYYSRFFEKSLSNLIFLKSRERETRRFYRYFFCLTLKEQRNLSTYRSSTLINLINLTRKDYEIYLYLNLDKKSRRKRFKISEREERKEALESRKKDQPPWNPYLKYIKTYRETGIDTRFSNYTKNFGRVWSRVA